MPIVLFGTEYWREVVDFDALVRHGTIRPHDVDLVHRTDSVDEAYDWIVRQLAEHALGQPGADAVGRSRSGAMRPASERPAPRSTPERIG